MGDCEIVKRPSRCARSRHCRARPRRRCRFRPFTAFRTPLCIGVGATAEPTACTSGTLLRTTAVTTFRSDATQSPWRLPSASFARVVSPLASTPRLPFVTACRGFGSHTPHSGLSARSDGASAAQPCLRGVGDAIHGLGKVAPDWYHRRVYFKHSLGNSRGLRAIRCHTIRVQPLAWNTGGGVFPKDSAVFPG